MKKLLVTGASGFLGYTLCQQAAKEWAVTGIVHAHPADIPDVNIISADITDYQAIKSLFSRIRPAAVIHVAALSKPNYCEQHPEEAYKTNCDSSAIIAGICAEIGCACVFTSTDMVFSGTKGMYREDDLAEPANLYGRTKLKAEKEMRACNPAATICRMPLMFGRASPWSGSLLQPILEKLRQGESVALFCDEYRTPVSAQTASEGLLMAVNHPGETMHLGGSQRVSRYEFGLIVAEAAGCKSSLVCKNLQNDVLQPAPRPRDVSLNSEKAYSMGYVPATIKEQLRGIL